MNSSSLGQIRISANTWSIAGIPDSIKRCPGSECLVVDRDDRLWPISAYRDQLKTTQSGPLRQSSLGLPPVDGVGG